MTHNLGIFEFSIGNKSSNFTLFRNFEKAKENLTIITAFDLSMFSLKQIREENKYTIIGYTSVNKSIERIVLQAYSKEIELPPEIIKKDLFVNRDFYCLMTNYKVGNTRVKAAICGIFNSEEELRDFAQNTHVYTEKEAKRCTLKKFYTMNKMTVWR